MQEKIQKIKNMLERKIRFPEKSYECKDEISFVIILNKKYGFDMTWDFDKNTGDLLCYSYPIRFYPCGYDYYEEEYYHKVCDL